ncbi:unnamed protein product [Rotaria sordida]|uniref:Uncharacterized protein n=1 Tax=Rotaria sordida TaxID=392033 RepID=A0A818I8H0_9BILA|nr:unnamed protein product [Rotaria sordida]CAF0772662.1 unnamed protein product [Rotaria sordida]CAF0782684.1 unnamed protein product [Rotaria sordida]CAF0845889.1 unnamed protein product [Rotaria sordida]CAF3515382.1 unnamed protein product [Rotaria sordida]
MSTNKSLFIRIFLIFLFFVIIYQQWNSSLTDDVPNFFSQHIRRSINRSHYPKEAFVTFTNSRPQYLELLDVLLDSIHLFSKRPVIIFSIDFDLIINFTRHPRVTIKRISQKNCGPTIFACKLLAIVSSELNYGIQLDIDSVVNYNIDLLFDMLHVWPYNLPLAPKHPDDPKNYRFYMEQNKVKYRTVPYMHASFVWTYRAYPFIRHVLTLMQHGAFMGANYDETAMNVMLWKAKTNHTLCKYDPYGPLYLEKYEKPQKSPACLPYCDGVYLVFHGQKDSLISKNILERLYKLGPNRPFVQTPQGVKWFNDTNVTCCHPSATRPSPLHPLLCEYDKFNMT